MSGAARPCPACGEPYRAVFVHGHGQCAHCGTNVEPCCAGASADDVSAPPQGEMPVVDPELFVRVFETLGGTTATVTRAALQHALVQRLGTDLADAKLLVDAGLRCGRLEAAGKGALRLGN